MIEQLLDLSKYVTDVRAERRKQGKGTSAEFFTLILSSSECATRYRMMIGLTYSRMTLWFLFLYIVDYEE